MAKWKAPEGSGGTVSIGGATFPIVNGFVVTPSDADYAYALAPFGYEQVPADEGEEDEADAALLAAKKAAKEAEEAAKAAKAAEEAGEEGGSEPSSDEPVVVEPKKRGRRS